MLFSSIISLFISDMMLVYYLIPSDGKRNIVLPVASLFFCSWGEPVYLFLMLYSALQLLHGYGRIHNEQKYGGNSR